MPFSWRWTKKLGRFRVTNSRSGPSISVGAGKTRIGVNASGRRWFSFRPLKGLTYRRSKGS
jgi:hypothetical protein